VFLVSWAILLYGLRNDLNVDREYKRGVAPLQNAFVKKWRP
jgi:hypothetical protein